MMEEDNEQCFMNGEDEEEEDDWSRPVKLHETIIGRTQKDASYKSELHKPSSWKQPAVDHPRVIVHIDVDCFYAQVEMIHNPALRDVPLGVQQKYLVVTCNYPARAQGVTKLMGVAEAKKKCPQLLLVSGEDLTRYREMSYKISEFLIKYTPNVERLGFDENFLDVTEMVEQRIRGDLAKEDVVGHIYSPQDTAESDSRVKPCSCGCHHRLAVGSQIAADIRSALNVELGISGCAGIAHNKLLAKVAGSQHKPNQQTTVYPRHGPSLVIGLTAARRIPGIGSATSRRLKVLGVETVHDLQHAPSMQLEEEFGVTMATTIQSLAFGMDPSPVVTYGKPQMLSIEDSFQCCNTEKDATSRVSQLITNLLPRVQDDGRTPHTLRLTVRRANKRHVHRESRQCNVPSAIAAKIASGQLNVAQKHLVSMAMTLFHRMVDIKQPFHLKLISVAFTKLEETTNNIAAFFTSQPSALSTLTSSRDCDQHSDTDPCATPKAPQQHPKTPAKSATDNTTVDYPKRRLSGNLSSFFAKKQKVEETVCDLTESGGKSGRKREDSTESQTAGCSDSAGDVTLPAGVDPDVFIQLPEEIQQEILRNVPRPHSDRNTVPMESSVSLQNSTDKVTVPCASEFRNGDSSSTSGEQKRPDGSFCVQTKKAIFSPKKDKIPDSSFVRSVSHPEKLLRSDTHDQTHDCSHTGLETKHAEYSESKDDHSLKSKNLDFLPSGCVSEQRTHNTQTTRVGGVTIDSMFQNLQQKSPPCSKTYGARSSPVRGKKKSLIDSIHNPKMSVPKGIAPDVFSALPPDLQREVAAEMAIQKHNAATSSSLGNLDFFLKKTQAKSPAKQANSMLNYLKKR
ncbi:hypothetical protein ACOMHN_034610 [Nucella lapillus]